MTVTEYCEGVIRDRGSVCGLENVHRQVIEELAVRTMHEHVRAYLGENPSNNDSNLNSVYVLLLATIIRTMRIELP